MKTVDNFSSCIYENYILLIFDDMSNVNLNRINILSKFSKQDMTMQNEKINTIDNFTKLITSACISCPRTLTSKSDFTINKIIEHF